MTKQPVFPARAGMSRHNLKHLDRVDSVPRASGDEPNVSVTAEPAGGCSPRERG